MKVLLLRDVKKVGRRYEVKEVSDGYARNFLISQKLAVPADEKAISIKKEQEAKDKLIEDTFKNWANKLESEVLEFKVKTGSKGEVFGSVDAEQIKKVLMERGVETGEVILQKPIKTLGDHQVEVNFGRGVRGVVKVRLIS